MKAGRAILLAILLWILIFVEVSIFKIALGLTGPVQYLIYYIFLILFGVLMAWIYYKSRDRMSGFVLGLFLLLVANLLDLFITIPMFLEGNYSGFYSDPFLWVGFLIVIIVTGVYDIARKK